MGFFDRLLEYPDPFPGTSLYRFVPQDDITFQELVAIVAAKNRSARFPDDLPPEKLFEGYGSKTAGRHWHFIGKGV